MRGGGYSDGRQYIFQTTISRMQHDIGKNFLHECFIPHSHYFTDNSFTPFIECSIQLVQSPRHFYCGAFEAIVLFTCFD